MFIIIVIGIITPCNEYPGLAMSPQRRPYNDVAASIYIYIYIYIYMYVYIYIYILLYIIYNIIEHCERDPDPETISFRK